MSLKTQPGARMATFRAMIVRGLISGLLAGVIAGGVGFAIGESLIDQAITWEDSAVVHTHEESNSVEGGAASAHSHDEAETPFVSRDVQRVGLVAATMLTGGAAGVLLAVASFIAARRFNVQLSSGIIKLALGGWTAIVAIPFLIIPPNPPGVGTTGTIDQRTSIWLMAVLLGLGSLAIWFIIRRWLKAKNLPAVMINCLPVLAGLVVVLTGWTLIPPTGTDYTGFPADLLWNFRMSSAATQLTLWISLGVVFQYFTERQTRHRTPR